MQDDWTYATTSEKRKQIRARVHGGLTTEAREESQVILAAQTAYWNGEKRAIDKRARSELQMAEARERFHENCTAAGIPDLPEKPAEGCDTTAQRQRARTISGELKSLAEMLGDDAVRRLSAAGIDPSNC